MKTIEQINKQIEELEKKKLELEMLRSTTSSMSVNQITRKLKEEHNIQVSPQVVKRHLDELHKKGDLEKI